MDRAYRKCKNLAEIKVSVYTNAYPFMTSFADFGSFWATWLKRWKDETIGLILRDVYLQKKFFIFFTFISVGCVECSFSSL